MGNPLAYFLTTACYGNRLHGDERGTVDREHNVYNSPTCKPTVKRERANQALMKQTPFKLNAAQRAAVEDAIKDACAFRKWYLWALNVRTNHAHIVVTSNLDPDRTLGILKARATRLMRERGLIDADRRVWVSGGSTRWLFNDAALMSACDYVLNRQGPDLPRA